MFQPVYARVVIGCDVASNCRKNLRETGRVEFNTQHNGSLILNNIYLRHLP